MRVSSPILPLRIYDNLFDQQRFNFHSSEVEQVDLVYPPHELPHFQFKRTSSIYGATKFLLRNICEDENDGYGYYKQIPEPANTFSEFAANAFFGTDFPTIGVTTPSSGLLWQIGVLSCGKLVTAPDNPTYTVAAAYGEWTIPLTSATGKYQFKIVVDKITKVLASTFSIKVMTGPAGTVLGTITRPGTYVYTFDAIAASVYIKFDGWQKGDLFEISEVQAIKLKYLTPLSTDVVLNQANIGVKPLIDGTDIVYYCEANQNYAPAPGYYYYIINVNNTNYYFSEVFKIVSVKELEKYYRLKWYHSCDLKNEIIYKASTLLCNFQNVLYLDAALFNSEPATKEEGIETRDGDFTPQLITWQNTVNFEITKAPRFLAESLSAVILHDTILIQPPVNEHQLVNTEELQVLRLVPEVSSIMSGHFQKVNLKLILDNYNTRSGCCVNAEVVSSITIAKYVATTPPCGAEGFDFVLAISEIPEIGDGLISCDTGELVTVEETDYIFKDGKYYTLTLVDGGYQVLQVYPKLNTPVSETGYYALSGKVIPYTFAEIQYQKDGGLWTVQSTMASDGDGNFAYDLPESVVAGSVSFKLRVLDKTYAETLATSDEITLI